MRPDHLEDRLAQLRDEWPAGSVVNDVMARLGTSPPRKRRRLLAALAASGLVAALGLAWLMVATQPKTLLAAVRDDLVRAASAHLVMTYRDEHDREQKGEVWYRKGEGLRAELPEGVIVENAQFQWSWQPGLAPSETIVLRQRAGEFFSKALGTLLALPHSADHWGRERSPALDRAVNGQACLAYTLTPPAPDLPPGATPADPRLTRFLVLADATERVREVTIERQEATGTWHPIREIRIDYDAPVSREQVAVKLPEGVRVVDRDEAFNSLHPLAGALHEVELGGLILAVHDVRPLQDRAGFYVVSSVRGSARHLEQFPPHRRIINPEVSALDVATQPVSSGTQGAKYFRIGLGQAAREGVQYTWWLILPHKYFRVRDGRRIDEPENDASFQEGEPGRLDDRPGVVHLPLSATYLDPHHRDANGAQQDVSQWVTVPLPNVPPAPVEDVAARARRDLVLMRHGGLWSLYGVAADAQGLPTAPKPLSNFEPERISDADYAAAVRRGIDDMRRFDEIRDEPPGGEPAMP